MEWNDISQTTAEILVSYFFGAAWIQQAGHAFHIALSSSWADMTLR